MYGIGIIFERHAGVGFEIINVDIFVNVDNVFSFRVDFDENLFLAHWFDNFSNIGSGFLEVVEFFPEHADFGVEGIAVCFETLEVCCAFLYGLNLVWDSDSISMGRGILMDRAREFTEWIEMKLREALNN